MEVVDSDVAPVRGLSLSIARESHEGVLSILLHPFSLSKVAVASHAACRDQAKKRRLSWPVKIFIEETVRWRLVRDILQKRPGVLWHYSVSTDISEIASAAEYVQGTPAPSDCSRSYSKSDQLLHFTTLLTESATLAAVHCLTDGVHHRYASPGDCGRHVLRLA